MDLLSSFTPGHGSPPHLPWLSGRLELDAGKISFLGETRIQLLEAIAIYGSISQAAKAVPLSYKAAWDAVDAMNNLSPFQLVERTTGGKSGGGTTLTEYGRKIIQLYRTLEQQYQQTINQLNQVLDGSLLDDLKPDLGTIRRLGMKTSARNQFYGVVEALLGDEVNIQVRLKLDNETRITATITRESAENLSIRLGTEACALIKSSSIILTTDTLTHTSADNALRGTVKHLHEGKINTEVTLALEQDKTITALVTHHSAQAMQLTVGMPAGALFKASDVILATFD